MYGVLMEYVDAPAMDSAIAGEWTEQQQVDLVSRTFFCVVFSPIS